MMDGFIDVSVLDVKVVGIGIGKYFVDKFSVGSYCQVE